MGIENPVSAARELCILTLGARGNVLYLELITTQNHDLIDVKTSITLCDDTLV
jgi:hypothetical protein